jgi:hypothetical protein
MVVVFLFVIPQRSGGICCYELQNQEITLIKTQTDYDLRYPDVPLERWRNNLIDVATRIGDTDYQERNWLRDDRPARENPDEIICSLCDDCLFELFLADCDFSFTVPQREAAQDLSSKMNQFLANTPQSLNPFETLRDPRWEVIQVAARNFVAAFIA